MRKISTDAFWEAALAGDQRHQYKSRIAALNEESNVITPEGVESRLEMLLDLRLDVAPLHQCSDAAAIRDYHQKMVDLIYNIYDTEHLYSPDFPPEEDRSVFHKQIELLNRSFDEQRRCHPAYEGHICYCDERLERNAA